MIYFAVFALGFACATLFLVLLSNGSDWFCFNCGRFWGFGRKENGWRVWKCSRCQAGSRNEL